MAPGPGLTGMTRFTLEEEPTISVP